MEFDEGRPRWRQVHEIIAARIRSGEYPPGSRVPSGVAIATEYGIAMGTAQKVLRQLRADGLTRTELGLGSFVAKQLPPEA